MDESAREHVTVGWGPLVTVITDEWWYNANIWGEGELLYRVREDPNLEHSLAADRPEVCKRCSIWPCRTRAAASRPSLSTITTSRAARPLRTGP